MELPVAGFHTGFFPGGGVDACKGCMCSLVH